MVFMPVIVLFYQKNGLSMKEVFILQSIFSLSIVLFEIPSGYLSDIIGRRLSITIGCALSVIGFGFYSISYGFTGFLIAELLLGLATSFVSGSDSALLYDTLLLFDKEDEYTKAEGRITSIGNFSEGLAAIAGGLLALISLRTPFYAETIIALLSVPVALSLYEPERKKYDNSDGNLIGMLRIVKYSLHDHVEVKWFILYSSLISASTLTIVWFIQPFLKAAGLPLEFFGIVWAALQFSVGVFSLYAYRFEMLLGKKKSLVSLIVLTFIGYLLLSMFQSLWAALFLFIFYFVRGIAYPVLKDYINELISSDIRATVLSVKSLAARLNFSLIGPLVGWISDIYSLSTALLASGIIFLCLGMISLIFLHKHRAL